jgi:hypothetical protein
MAVKAGPPPDALLYRSPAEKASLELHNLRRQNDAVAQLVTQADGALNITPGLIAELHRVAMVGIYPCAGRFRTWPICIPNAPHQPPAWPEVSALVDEMCTYANAVANASPLHTAAYLMWRLTWIHPFGGGNGRTARAVAYYALCVRLGCVLPGRPTIPEQIRADCEHYRGLRAADAAWLQGRLDVRYLEGMLAGMLLIQLTGAYNAAAGIPTLVPPLPTAFP